MSVPVVETHSTRHVLGTPKVNVLSVTSKYVNNKFQNSSTVSLQSKKFFSYIIL